MYLGEFSAIRWAPGDSAYNYLQDLIDIFEEHGWDWAYHAFREWDGWSVEHGPDPKDHARAKTPTARSNSAIVVYEESRRRKETDALATKSGVRRRERAKSRIRFGHTLSEIPSSLGPYSCVSLFRLFAVHFISYAVGSCDLSMVHNHHRLLFLGDLGCRSK